VRLPRGLSARPLTDGDLDDVVAMVNSCEQHDTGEVMLERADLLADAGADGFDLDRDWVGIFDEGPPVAWGMLNHRQRASVDVHPDARGRGVGSWLRRWSETRVRSLGFPLVTQTVDDRRSDAVEMLTPAGYTPRATSWLLRIDHPERPPSPEPLDGVELRAFQQTDEQEVLAMFESAFSEGNDTSDTAATWRAMVTRREGFEDEDLVVAVAAFLIDADEIWVDKLAVDRAFRHRGIARALLQTAFVRSFERGYGWTSLSTDSTTDALALYERIGMTVRRSFTRYGLDL
jgi:GNAT superfamily N-acetyltransferase